MWQVMSFHNEHWLLKSNRSDYISEQRFFFFFILSLSTVLFARVWATGRVICVGTACNGKPFDGVKSVSSRVIKWASPFTLLRVANGEECLVKVGWVLESAHTTGVSLTSAFAVAAAERVQLPLLATCTCSCCTCTRNLPSASRLNTDCRISSSASRCKQPLGRNGFSRLSTLEKDEHKYTVSISDLTQQRVSASALLLRKEASQKLKIIIVCCIFNTANCRNPLQKDAHLKFNSSASFKQRKCISAQTFLSAQWHRLEITHLDFYRSPNKRTVTYSFCVTTSYSQNLITVICLSWSQTAHFWKTLSVHNNLMHTKNNPHEQMKTVLAVNPVSKKKQQTTLLHARQVSRKNSGQI